MPLENRKNILSISIILAANTSIVFTVSLMETIRVFLITVGNTFNFYRFISFY